MRVNNLKDGHIKKERFLRNGDGSLITTGEVNQKVGGSISKGCLIVKNLKKSSVLTWKLEIIKITQNLL